MGEENPTGYSASVRIWLKYQDQMIPLSHSSSTYVIAWEPIDLPAGDARIVFTIDGTQYEREVNLVNGMSSNSREAAVMSRDAIAPF